MILLTGGFEFLALAPTDLITLVVIRRHILIVLRCSEEGCPFVVFNRCVLSQSELG